MKQLGELMTSRNSIRMAVSAILLSCAAAAQAQVTTGVVSGGGVYQQATVCLDTNANARCDAGEATTTSDGSGAFSLTGTGAVVAQIRSGTTVFVPTGGSPAPVAQSLTFRAPAGSSQVVSAISTELQALIDANGGDANAALTQLASRVGVTGTQLLENYASESDSAVLAALSNETALSSIRIADALADAGSTGNLVAALRNRLALDSIQTVVVIYEENRSFDNLFGQFPGANGLRTAKARSIKQVDRDAVTVLPNLPPSWNGVTAAGQTPVVTQAQTTNVWPNTFFQIDNPNAPSLYGYSAIPNSEVTRDLFHRFFENQMQIDGGRNDQFAAWGDSGGLTMGYFDGSKTQLWSLAQQYTLADNFFEGAFGGSFLNHQYLICACAPTVPASTVTGNGMSINVLGSPNANGTVQLVSNNSGSALTVAPSLKSGNIAPLDYFGAGDGYRAVNTMQAAYQPSGNKPVDNTGNDPLYANPAAATTLPPQTQTTIGDLLNSKGISWAWYAGGWAAASSNPYPWNGTSFGTSTTIYNANSSGTADATATDFQAHHHPFNYYAAFDPVAHATDRATHLKDRQDLLNDIQHGTLPAVTFYKPVGYQNQHPGYTNVTNADQEISTLITALQQSPQWGHMLVVITYDEFGGQFDHVAPPKGDLLGPGTRIPAVIISPYAKKGSVDHTQYDTASILRFITHRYSLTPLAGLNARDTALVTNGGTRMGYLGGALSFNQ
jgi:acid phosphatase